MILDHQFDGYYYGKKKHESDIADILERCEENGVDRLLIVGGYIEDTQKSMKICKLNENYLTTVGVHPCRANVTHLKKLTI